MASVSPWPSGFDENTHLRPASIGNHGALLWEPKPARRAHIGRSSPGPQGSTDGDGFSTDHVHQRDRLDYRHEVACRDVVDYDSKPACRGTFRAEPRSASIGGLDPVCFHHSRMTVDRTNHHLSYTSTSEIFVWRQFRQHVALQQNGRQVVLDPGDVALIDPSMPYRGQFSDGPEILVAKVQCALPEGRIWKIRDLLAQKVATAEGRLASAYLADRSADDLCRPGRLRPKSLCHDISSL